MDTAMLDKPGWRLGALDLLRGLDMFLLAVVGPLVRAANAAWGLPSPIVFQFNHQWGGFTLWDLIMPLFIFMSGAAVPLAMRRRLDAEGCPTAAFWRHLAWRFAMLWVLGMVAQGRLLTLDVMKISPYSNTLQAIAVGYFVTCLAFIAKPKWFRPALAIACVAVYGLVMACCGDYTKTGNAAYLFDMVVLRHLVPAGSAAFETGGYTWFLTSFMFAAMALAGCVATEILLSPRTPRGRLVMLGGTGAALLAAGWALVPAVPMVKHYFSASFTMQAVGWSMLALAACYALVDMAGRRRGLAVIFLFGRDALFVYICHTVLRPMFKAFGELATVGVPHVAGEAAGTFAAAFASAALLVFLVWRRARMRR